MSTPSMENDSAPGGSSPAKAGSPDSHSRSTSFTHSLNASQSTHTRNPSNASVSSLTVPNTPKRGHSYTRSLSRSSSRDFEYKETLDAHSRDLEDGSRIINQYRMLDVIGQGAYGTVHRAVLVHGGEDGVEFAIKEFGKTRLRKNHRAANLRKPLGRGRGRTRGGFAAGPPAREGAQGESDLNQDPLHLIRHEIAILKKLRHPNVVKLFEVLDDPSKDSLYMVFECCKDGPVIRVRLNESVEPLDEHTARNYFIQILLGVEYLHSNDIVHRDLKPDNILLTDEKQTCKIVDFGVSEMFTKSGDDTLQKSAGTPAFMSPGLCTAGHSGIHGKSDDIWSLGVTLYCMVVGHLPFDKTHFLEMYEAIKNDEPEYPDHLSEELKSLLKAMLNKDPEKRVNLQQIREHDWITRSGEEPLISTNDNLEMVVLEVTDEELDCAICSITSVFTIARAIQRFKRNASQSMSRSLSQGGSSIAASTGMGVSGSSGGGETFAGMLPRDEPRSSSPQVGSPSTLSPSSEQGPFFDDQGSSKEKKDSSQTQCRSQHQRQQQYQYERRRAQGMDSLSSIPSRMDSMNSLPSVGSDNVPIIRADDQSPPLAESPVMAESPTSTTPSSMGSRSESGSGNEEKGGDGDGGGGKAVDRVHGKVEVEQEDEQERSMPGHFSIEQVGRKLKDTWLDEERLEGEGGREEVRGHTHEREHEHQHVHVRERDGHDGEKGVQEPLRRHERKRGREHIHLRRAVAEGHNNRDGPFKEGDEGHDAENADDHHLHPNTQNKAGGHRSGDGSGDGGGEGDHDPDLLPPKLLDGPWAKSPMSENIPTPPGAAEAYSGRYFSESP